MPDDADAFCNGDDDLLRAMTCRQRKVTFGLYPPISTAAASCSGSSRKSVSGTPS